MSAPFPSCFVRLEHTLPVPTSTLELSTLHQQFITWLSPIEQALTALPTPLLLQYDQQGILVIWEANNIDVATLAATLEPLTNNSKIAMDQGAAIYDNNRHWCYSSLPARLPALLQVGQHYEAPLVLGEAVATALPREQLNYLTRSYFAGASTALEVYAWKKA